MSDLIAVWAIAGVENPFVIDFSCLHEGEEVGEEDDEDEDEDGVELMMMVMVCALKGQTKASSMWNELDQVSMMP